MKSLGNFKFIPIIRTKPLAVIICIVTIIFLTDGILSAQGFQIKKISDKITIIYNPDIGSQVVLMCEKGLVIFDSFWSERTARLFKQEISKNLGRDDFTLLINMVDRLDMLGGNTAYQGITIFGHKNISTKYSNKKTVDQEVTRLIKMWRHKEEVSRKRLEKHEKDSKEAKKEQDWLNKCKSIADDLEAGYSLVLPDILFNDRITINLKNISMDLIWFGNTGNYTGQTAVIIPSEKLAILSKSVVYPMHHLAPGLQPDYRELDISRWIEIFEEMFEGENAVDNLILCDDYNVYSKKQMQDHLRYIRTLWTRVTTLEKEEKSLKEITELLSLEKEFAFVKDMLAFKNNGENWIRPQHELHIRLFFLQHKKNLASEIIKAGGIESLHASLDKIRKMGNNVYVDETSIGRLGYVWSEEGHIAEAIEIYKLYTEAYPQSVKAYINLADAYQKIGDTKKAIENYRKCLHLNPGNKDVKLKLERLELRETKGNKE